MLGNISLLTAAQCNSSLGFPIPDAVFNLVHYVILIIQVVVPILLIIWGMLDFAKGLVKGKDDDIKAGQKTFVSRLIIAIMVFLIVTITKLAISVVASLGTEGTANEGTLTNCIEAFINGAN